jgi:hypothetical protein
MNDTGTQSIGASIVAKYRKEVRARTGEDLSDKQIYSAAGIDHSLFYKIIRGEVSSMSKTLMKLRRLCECEKPHLRTALSKAAGS